MLLKVRCYNLIDETVNGVEKPPIVFTNGSSFVNEVNIHPGIHHSLNEDFFESKSIKL